MWGAGASPAVARRSVHAPAADEASFAELCAAVDRGEVAAAELVLETMYPGFALGSGAELAWALARRLPLAVDIAHLAIQRAAGVLDAATLARVLDCDHIAEIHVSQSDNARDRHLPLAPDTFGLAWARERERAGATIVLECYMHRLPLAERQRQIELLRS